MANVGYNMKTNLKYIYEMVEGEQQPTMTKEEKAELVNAMKNFSTMGKTVYSNKNLKEVTENVRDIIERTDRLMQENGDWFDSVTTKRNMKTIHEAYKTFESTAQEMTQLQQRMEAAYEDVATNLSRYFDVQ